MVGWKTKKKWEQLPGELNGSPRRLRARPLLAILLTLITSLVLLTAAVIGFTTYLNTYPVLSGFADANLRNAAEQAAIQTRLVMEAVHPVLLLTREQAREDPAFGALSQVRPTEAAARARARQFLRVMRANPLYTMSHYGDRYGDLIGARGVVPGDREPNPPFGRPEAVPLRVDYRRNGRRLVFPVNPDGSWGSPQDSQAPFDATRRPWYRLAARKRDLVWTRPYPFFETGRPGITASIPLVQNGEVLGVFGIDFELGELERHIQSLNGSVRAQPIGSDAQVFLVTEWGGLEQTDESRLFRPAEDVFVLREHGAGVIHSDGRQESFPTVASRTSDGPADDPALTSAVAGLYRERPTSATAEQRPLREFRTPDGRFLGVYQHFQVRNLPCMAVVAIPRENLVGPLRRNSLATAGLCLLLLAFTLTVGGFLALRLSRPLRAFAREMEQVERFIIPAEPSAPSSIEEVQVIGQAMDRMKTSLRSFAKYVPADLVRTLHQAGQEARLGGQTATLTLFFADVFNFTATSERMNPMELVDALADYLEQMEDTVERHDGIVDKYIGDAVMAFWGAPIRPLENPELGACLAALEYVQRFRKLREEREARGLLFFEAGIGIHTGEALVGNIGSQRRMNYTAMGDAVNVASCLEDLNRVYGTRILISETTYMAVRDEFEVRPIDRVSPKGRCGAIQVYELLARRGELDPKLRPVLDLYEEGLHLYRRREWVAARDCFLRALALDLDGPSRLYLARCHAYALEPPDDDWDGVYVLPRR